MGFVEAISSGFRNYVGFSGRAPRSEYWFWILFVMIWSSSTSIIDLMIAPRASVRATDNHRANWRCSCRASPWWFGGCTIDDKSGWWILLGLIPLVGGIILLVWFCTRGTVGPNRFGPDPLEGHDVSRLR